MWNRDSTFINKWLAWAQSRMDYYDKLSDVQVIERIDFMRWHDIMCSVTAYWNMTEGVA
jgi:hypothetical protein